LSAFIIDGATLVAMGLCLLQAALPIGTALHRWRTLRIPSPADAGRVTLVLPYGPPEDLAPLMQALAEQTLRPTRLIIAVADIADSPALPPLPFPCHVVVAGRAAIRGQKCHNQLAALDALDGHEDAIVLLDADSRPQPWWLAVLVGPVLGGTRPCTGGYRWIMPNPHPAVQAVAWLDRGWALLIKPSFCGIAWGGSLALKPHLLPLLRAALDRTLSDDLVFARRALEAGVPVVMRGASLVPSPLGAGALAFWTRQLRIVRLHNTLLWWSCVSTTAGMLVLWSMALAGTGWLLALLLAAGAVRAACQDILARRIDVPDPPATRFWQAVYALTLLPDVIQAWCLPRSAFGRRVTWRGITYSVARDGSARVETDR
jgi:hypothetical protein